MKTSVQLALSSLTNPWQRLRVQGLRISQIQGGRRARVVLLNLAVELSGERSRTKDISKVTTSSSAAAAKRYLHLIPN